MRDNIILLIVVFIYILMPEFALAKDFSGSLRNMKNEVSDILIVAGPLALMFAGGAFYLSRQIGTNLLVSSLIGVVIFASSGTIFQFLYRVFN